MRKRGKTVRNNAYVLQRKSPWGKFVDSLCELSFGDFFVLFYQESSIFLNEEVTLIAGHRVGRVSAGNKRIICHVIG
jgi:hypothetical protein